jgi:hypothetical protein
VVANATYVSSVEPATAASGVGGLIAKTKMDSVVVQRLLRLIKMLPEVHVLYTFIFFAAEELRSNALGC